MAEEPPSYYTIYRTSTYPPPLPPSLLTHLTPPPSLGTTLADSVDTLVSEGRLNPQLARKIVQNFDKCFSEVLGGKVRANINFKGKLDNYRFCDDVWTFALKDVTFKFLHGNLAPVGTGRLNILCVSNKKPVEDA